ncbi:hypothetical protein [Roseivirga thermotolerans]|uniref:hypothetical protein n=1 Tax=Roseivirga thermotolerans TaxID=1758176 RepID=UPI00273E09D9|nr:hypothetical protein [Roseivirga thermotolerans]
MYLPQAWSPIQKVSFRFTFIFFLLFILPFPFSTILGFFNEFTLAQAFSDFWTWCAKQVATSLLGMEGLPDGSPGSGDRTENWIQYGLFLLLAIVGTLVWSLADRNRKNYYRLWRVFVMVVVYYLVYFMAIYGFIKVFYLQMPELRIDRLLRTYGQSSPMGLLWTFMGASKTYSVYAGLSEVIAGTLLIFRRTRTLGGLVTFGVMFNVFMLNMAYDVPVKLFSAQLMLMGLYIALIDYKAILGVFIWQKPQAVTPWPPFFKSAQKQLGLLIVQVLFIGYIYYERIEAGISGRSQYGELRPKSALYGLYDVITFVKNGDTIPPLLTDDERWQRMIFESPQNTMVMYMDDRTRFYSSAIDTTTQTITISIGADSLRKDYPLRYEKLNDGLQIRGVLEQDSLFLQLKTYDLSRFYLTNRGFNWVNEVPWHRYDPAPKSNW